MPSDEYLINFFVNYMVKFPHDILIQIVELLTIDHITDFLVYLPPFRDILVQYYYSNEIQFVIQGYATYVTSCPLSTYQYLTSSHGIDIFQFLAEFPDIIPKRLVIHDETGDFSDVKAIMNMYIDRIRQIEEISVRFWREDATTEDFRYLLSFNNLTQIEISRAVVAPKLINNLEFSQHPKLNEVAIRVHGIDEWSRVQFPPGLKSLNLSSNPKFDIATLTIPPNLEKIKFHDLNITNFKFLPNKLCSNLTTLILTFNNLPTLPLDDLPCGLRTLDISRNKIASIVGSKWPQDLEVLSLQGNKLDDSALFDTDWPPKLVNLNLSYNKIIRIGALSNLPNTLEFLDMSHNPIVWQHTDRNFEFPKNLFNLELKQCGLNLNCIRFPVSLKKLTLGYNKISDICAYRYWTELVKLHTLKLSANLISSLNNWIIPPNLSQLDLNINPISALTNECPIFQDKYNFNLFELNLERCKISRIQVDYIPPSLKRVIISLNREFLQFIFPNCFKQLHHLDLSDNLISSFSFADGSADGKSQLRRLDLTGNEILGDKEISGLGVVKLHHFYHDLEANLGKVKERKLNVNSLHEFDNWNN
ncbi:hypothetical protein JA1_004202 [Spathaspora sp. JA1]|nr:hypothetical protein JA1_004202 [Spathaspora sp. JA1]